MFPNGRFGKHFLTLSENFPDNKKCNMFTYIVYNVHTCFSYQYHDEVTFDEQLAAVTWQAVYGLVLFTILLRHPKVVEPLDHLYINIARIVNAVTITLYSKVTM